MTIHTGQPDPLRPPAAPRTPEEAARHLRQTADRADRQIAAALWGDLETIAARCEGTKDFPGIPAAERSELQQMGLNIRRGLAAFDAVQRKGQADGV